LPMTFSENRTIWDIMLEKYGTDKRATDGSVIRRMRFACWIIKDTVTHSEYLIIIAFQRQHW
jgi:formylmethanofuran dehydrogenase subunit E-like metal-binding protein